MDLRHLRTFVTVVDMGTVSKAALRLHIAQPALSRQIRALEEELGIALFDRIGGRLQLSSAGERLLGDCRGLLTYARHLSEQAQLLHRADAGVLHVAASPHYLESIFPDFLHVYRARFPHVDVRLEDVIGSSVVGMLERGEIHLAQATSRQLGPAQSHIGSKPLQPVEMLAAYPPALPIGRRGSIEIEELAPYSLLQTGAEYVIRRTFDAACRLAGFEPKNALESRSPHALLAMAQADHGIAVIPSAIRVDGYRLKIARIRFRGKVLSEPLHVLFDRRRYQPPYAVAFCDMLAVHVRRTFPLTRQNSRSRQPSTPRTN